MGLQSNASAAGNLPIGQQTSGTAEAYEQSGRFLVCGCYDESASQSGPLVVVSSCLSRGDFSRGFGSLSLPMFCGFKGFFSIFRVKVRCLISVGLSTGKSLLVWGPQVTCKLD